MKVSDGLRKVSDGVGKVSDGVWKGSDGVWKVWGCSQIMSAAEGGGGGGAGVLKLCISAMSLPGQILLEP